MNNNKLIQGNEEENNKILSSILADEIRQKRSEQNPTAQELLNSVQNYKVVFK